MDSSYKAAVAAIANISRPDVMYRDEACTSTNDNSMYNDDNYSASTSLQLQRYAPDNHSFQQQQQQQQQSVEYDDASQKQIVNASRRVAAVGQHISPPLMPPEHLQKRVHDYEEENDSRSRSNENAMATTTPTRAQPLAPLTKSLSLQRSPCNGHFTSPLSIQEMFFPKSRCFGCGPANRYDTMPQHEQR